MKVTSHPWLLGGFLGFCLFVAITISAFRFPWIWSDNNEWLVRLVFFGLIYLAILISRYWKLRGRLRLWGALIVVILANAACGLVFTTTVRQMGIWPLSFALGIEFFGAAVFLDWFLDYRRG